VRAGPPLPSWHSTLLRLFICSSWTHDVFVPAPRPRFSFGQHVGSRGPSSAVVDSGCGAVRRQLVTLDLHRMWWPSWCPGPGHLLASAALLCMAPEPRTATTHDSSIVTSAGCSCGCRAPTSGTVVTVSEFGAD